MKSLDEFVKLFAELFDETDENQFAPNTEFRELDEWSSLIGLSVIAMVDDEFEVALKGADIGQAVTIEDLYKVILSKI